MEVISSHYFVQKPPESYANVDFIILKNSKIRMLANHYGLNKVWLWRYKIIIYPNT